MKHCSIIVVHYSHIDDFGATSAGKHPPSRSDLVKRCISSIIHNTDYPAELIVVDNGGVPDDSNYFLGLARLGKLTLVRFPQNMHFAYAWNYGAKIATGDYLSFVCNDIEVKPTWLSNCISILEKYPEVIATPFITYDKRKMTSIKDDLRFNPRSGSNCMVLTRELFNKIGEFPHHRVGGTIWYNRIKKMGIQTVAPIEDLAVDMGWRRGVNFNIPIKVRKILLDNSEADFTAPQQ